VLASQRRYGRNLPCKKRQESSVHRAR
jgi:hypothetical protein